MQAAQGNGAPLEDRLRNLILNNSDNEGNQNAPQQAAPTGAEAEEAVSANKQSQGQKGRKRPNQAQRRQMSAQLSIPIDHRPTQSQSSRSFANHSSGYGNRQYPSSNQQRDQRPQSATFRPTYQNQEYPNPALTAGSYPSQPRHQQSPSYPGFVPPRERNDWRHQHGQNADFGARNQHRGQQQFDSSSPRHPRNSGGTLFNPRQNHVRPEDLKNQVALLERLCNEILVNAEIDHADIMEKESFRMMIEQVCRAAVTQHEQEQNDLNAFPPMSVQLKCFGSLSSGFATKASDMDLGLISPLSIPQPDSHDSAIPRVIEKAFLDIGLGARLLTRTRVPIIKLCEKPPEKLLHDLREERLKWEKGVDDDPAAEEEDGHDDVIQNPGNETNNADGHKAGHSSKLSDAGGVPGSDKYQHSLDTFHQGATVHLLGYYNMAKRLLRKLGGRDISHSTANDFGPEDYKILNDVCHAFLRGLADEALRTSLERYTSLSFSRSPTTNMPSNRSLAGVFTQMEGERLALMWECRHIHEKDDHQENFAQNKINFWKEVQNKLTFGLDPLSYNRELQIAADQLRKIPSLELMLLEQGQYESASQYHGRAIKLMLDLGGHDSVSPSNEKLSAVVRHYIAGISHEDIREQVTEFAESIGSTSLKAIARRHRSLQLAKEFDKALEKDLYDEEDASAIRAYLPILRGPMEPTSKMGEYFDFVVPVTTALVPLLTKMNTVSDPAKLAPNQPRDPYKDRLEFPKSGVGVQCDINFSAHLALHNTLLLRCYSHADPRVRPLVLFVKHWAKVRGINTPYRGTLSSYGYVLMMLHYLVNVAQPFVCPNLQELAPPPDPNLPPEIVEEMTICKGRNVHFWRDEEAIKHLARQGSLTQNQDSIGYLIRGFFEYYAQSNMMSTVQARGFDWGRDVLSIRTQGGLLSKQEKGWTGAKTVFEVQNKAAPPPASEPSLMQANPQTPTDSETPTPTATPSQPLPSPGEPPKSSHDKAKGEVKEIRHRYLFAIEDPFELDHNVARTVTHNGIVAIRDEFRRAWRIIRNAGRNAEPENLLEDATADKKRERDSFSELLIEIHGNKLFDE